MVIKSRGQIVQPMDTVQLRATFADTNGTPVDPDTFPSVLIRDSSGLVNVGPTSAGVVRNSIGVYEFDFLIGISPAMGVYNDLWSAKIGGFPVTSTFSFIVSSTDLPSLNSDGYMALGDDVPFNYSQTAILNINKLIKGARERLSSTGKSKRTDANGNTVYIDCSIYSVSMLTSLCAMSLSHFNQVPMFTNFTWEDTVIIDQFYDILVTGAVMYALASKALIERGREFALSDNGLQFTPPTVSEMLNTQYNTVLANYWDQIKYIKNSMRANPKGLGTLTITATNPMLRRLSQTRARRFL